MWGTCLSLLIFCQSVTSVTIHINPPVCLCPGVLPNKEKMQEPPKENKGEARRYPGKLGTWTKGGYHVLARQITAFPQPCNVLNA